MLDSAAAAAAAAGTRALAVCVIDARKTAFRQGDFPRCVLRFPSLFFFFFFNSFILAPFTRDMRTASEREPEREHNESY